ncbi:hypothetical protein KFE25_008013 [Diacronema lutheri]|uniref:Sodium/hydrogen exchanger n=1 Tax=Diacronema lutheri TaxID=2081491 RepID=A0A8J5XN45_DIALT|nr:hypothetical protein KFE25_008013 [Diacronema lutheri]
MGGEHVAQGHAESHWSIAIGLGCLPLTLVAGRALEARGVSQLPEAGVAVLLGAAASGAVAAVVGDSAVLRDMRFDFEFFVVWLLPPIIFEAGFNMNRRAFFANLAPTALLAVAGTLFSTAVVGSFVYGAGRAGLCHALGGDASFFFGALISATDPVTVLAVFQRLGVKAELFAVVFGESVLNDAVALVLSRVLLSFQTVPLTPLSALGAALSFAYCFAGSLLVGAACGATSALLHKHAGLRTHADALYAEAAVIFACAWGSYYVAEGLHLSGIVAILFCGIAMAQYTRDNLSMEAKALSARALKVVALLAEAFIFVYLGMATFAFPILHGTPWSLVAVALVACALGRTHVYALAHATNGWRESVAGCVPGPYVPVWLMKRAPDWLAGTRLLPDPHLARISTIEQHVLLFCGLRGGVAFAIAAAAYERGDFATRGDSLAILQTTLMVAFFTIFVLGGLAADVAKAAAILDAQRARGGEAAARSSSTTEPRSRLQAWERAHLRPFLTASDPAATDAAAAGEKAEAQLGTPRAAVLDARYGSWPQPRRPSARDEAEQASALERFEAAPGGETAESDRTGDGLGA